MVFLQVSKQVYCVHSLRRSIHNCREKPAIHSYRRDNKLVLPSSVAEFNEVCTIPGKSQLYNYLVSERMLGTAFMIAEFEEVCTQF